MMSFEESVMFEKMNPDRLLTTKELSALLRVSQEFLEIGRKTGGTPPHIHISPKCVRYRLSTVREWLAERTFNTVQDAAKAGHKLARGKGKKVK